jgi:acyl-CoA reductase-like NAD-dependent aldehyde dehydrogenase
VIVNVSDKLSRNRQNLTAGTRNFLGGGVKKLLINGRWVDARSGETFDIVDPTTEDVVGAAASADKADVDEAVSAARATFESDSWSGMSPHARTSMLLAVARLLDAHVDELAQLETINNGAPISKTRLQAAKAVEVFEYFAGWPTKILGDVTPSGPSMLSYVVREPVGVCAQIIPWNGPLLSAAWKIAPALACGNTVVLKPAEQTPLTAVRMGELLMEAGVPAGAVNILTGFGGTAGAALANHGDIDKVAFTGSTEVGKKILQDSAGNLKRVTLELGGKSPNILFDDANLDRAIEGALRAFCSNSGQVCMAGSRIFVQRGIYDEVIDRLTKAAAAHRIGDPLDEATTMGPLISRRQFERVNGYVDIGRGDGASLQFGGRRYDGKGFFVEPTLFADVTSSMRIVREEIFGPVAAIIPFTDEDEVVAMANDTAFGLAAGIWTRDVGRAHSIARRIRAGSIWVNSYLIIDPATPFGGYKQSGIGRELGTGAIDAYTETKSIFVDLGG